MQGNNHRAGDGGQDPGEGEPFDLIFTENVIQAGVSRQLVFMAEHEQEQPEVRDLADKEENGHPEDNRIADGSPGGQPSDIGRKGADKRTRHYSEGGDLFQGCVKCVIGEQGDHCGQPGEGREKP